MKAFSKSGKVRHALTRLVYVRCLVWIVEPFFLSLAARYVVVEDATQ